MVRHWLRIALLPIGSLVAAVPAIGLGQEPVKPSANPENIDAALKLTLAAAAEYKFVIGKDDKPLELRREPVLRWSNPNRGEIHSNVRDAAEKPKPTGGAP